MGTRNGIILETQIDSKEKYVKEVFFMQQSLPICALQIEVFPDAASVERKYFVMAATANPSRYFQFVGGPDFETLFKYYRDLDRQNCTELPGRIHSFIHSLIHLFTHSLIHSFTYSLTLSLTHSFTNSQTHSLFQSSIRF